MPDKIIISDTSSLIALTNIGKLQILNKIYNRITITHEISKEFGIELPEWIDIQENKNLETQIVLQINLDVGEASAIALAYHIKESLLIIDEKKGRGIAKALGIKVIGILGVLIKAKNMGVIKALRPVIDDLEKSNFRISDQLKQDILKSVNE